MKKLILIAILGFGSVSLIAQQDPMFTHYMFNTLSVNPGYAGSRDALTVTGLGRFQWVGFEGAPITQTVTLHTPIIKPEFGLGLSVVNDQIGPLNATSFYADFAYHLKVNDRGHQLSFGLKGGGNLVSGNLSQLNTIDNNDNAFMTDVPTQFSPNVGFGMYYYTDRWYAGASTPRLLENSFETGSVEKATVNRHYFLIGGAVFTLNEYLKLKPSTFVKVTESAPVEADLSALLIVNDYFYGGAMFRTGDAFGILAGINVNPQFTIGYSFDWSYGVKTFRYNGGSHEIMLRYDFIFKDEGKIKSPRYF